MIEVIEIERRRSKNTREYKRHACFQRIFSLFQVKMGRRCAAACCKEEMKKDSPYSFHRFPTEPKIRQQWAVKPKVNRETRNEKGKRVQWQPADHDVLCSKHCIESCYTDRTILSRTMNLPYMPHLREDAIPTIFMHNYAKRKKEEEYAAKRLAIAEKKRRIEVSANRGSMSMFPQVYVPPGLYPKSCICSKF